MLLIEIKYLHEFLDKQLMNIILSYNIYSYIDFYIKKKNDFIKIRLDINNRIGIDT